MRMPFGKHKGVEISAVPTSYLEWLLDHAQIHEPLTSEIFKVLQDRRWEGYQAPAPPPINDDAIRGIYRRLAMKWHPDRGGSTQAMAALNEFYSEILGAI